jgi:DNA-binding MarR family transcriptional regulator
MEHNIDLGTLSRLFWRVVDSYKTTEGRHLRMRRLFHLSQGDIRAVLRLGETRHERMSNLARHMKLTMGTLTTTIDRLVQKGYVNRERPEDDRRVVEVFLSSDGEDLYRQLVEIQDDATVEMFGILNDSERQSLHNILSKLASRKETE